MLFLELGTIGAKTRKNGKCDRKGRKFPNMTQEFSKGSQKDFSRSFAINLFN